MIYQRPDIAIMYLPLPHHSKLHNHQHHHHHHHHCYCHYHQLIIIIITTIISIVIIITTSSSTRTHDEEAMRYLSLVMYPLVLGYSMYSLAYETHKSW